jgi:hypothetical protein
VLIVAAIGNEAGGLLGRRPVGRQLLEHPVPAPKMRKKAAAKGEDLCKKWGRAAVPLSRGPAGAWDDRPAGTTGARCSGRGCSRAGVPYESRQEGEGPWASADITDSRHPFKGPLAC